MSTGAKLVLNMVLCLALACIIMWNANLKISFGKGLQVSSDANSLIRMAYHLCHSKTYSIDRRDTESPKPDAYREPAYSTFLACVVGLNNRLERMDMKTLGTDLYSLRVLRQVQIPILLLTSFMAMYLVTSMTGRIIYGYFALILVGFSYGILVSITSMKIENFSAFWVMAVALTLYKAVQTKSLKYFIMLGISLGILVLTKAMFMYFFIIIIAYMGWLFKVGQFEKQKVIRGILIFVGVYSVIVGSWMTRNYVQFKQLYITGRSGAVLSIRGEYNMMNSDEYFGSFLYWTPDSFVMSKIGERYGANALQPGGKLANLNRSNKEGYYRAGRAVRDKVNRAHGGESPKTDKMVKRIAMKEILSHPFRHIAVTIPMAWRGIFVEKAVMTNVPFAIVVSGGVGICIVYFASFFTAVFISIRKKNWQMFAVLLPMIYLYGMNTLFTHSLPRYNEPLIPLLVSVLMVLVCSFVHRPAKKQAK